jgi:hypothetical protein
VLLISPIQIVSTIPAIQQKGIACAATLKLETVFLNTPFYPNLLSSIETKVVKA